MELSRSTATIIFSSFFLLCSTPSFGSEPVIIRPELRTIRSGWFNFEYREPDRPSVAVILSGGGARGMAQIGVLKALEANGVPVDFIAATSLGAVVGGLYAAGYSPAQLESLAVSSDWDDILSLTSDTRRSDLLVDQKKESDRTFFSLRFEGFEPVLPAAVSSGQRLTDFLSHQVLQAVYHTDSTFDDLRIPFRAISTDLISGERIVLADGSLAEALRASATVPLLFNPVEKDSLRLIDGGLVSNIPVDVALEKGYDIIIAVNTTSGLRKEDELNAPWQTADQIMGIMMQFENREQLRLADFVIEPRLGRHLSSDFTSLDSLIREGESAAERIIGDFWQQFYRTASYGSSRPIDLSGAVIGWRGFRGTGPAWDSVKTAVDRGVKTTLELEQLLADLFRTGELEDIHAEVYPDEVPVKVFIEATPHPILNGIALASVTRIDERMFLQRHAKLIGARYRPDKVTSLLEDLLREYRRGGYSLARVNEAVFDPSTGILRVDVTEGVISKIHVTGTERTKDYVVLREFPLEEGDVFEIGQAGKGVANLAGTTLFDYVNLDVSYANRQPEITIDLRERPSQLLSLGMRIDDERNLQGLLEIKDDNLAGTGTSAGISISGGGRNQEYLADFHSHRLFSTTLSLRVAGFLSVFDSYFYGDAVLPEPNCWERENLGEYRDRRYGGLIQFGTQIEKVGNTFFEYSLQRVRISNRQDLPDVGEEYDLSRLRFGTVLDSKNSYPFPTSGVWVDLSFETAFEWLGGDVGYNAVRVGAETFLTWAKRHTIHPKGFVGFADRTMPFGEQFRLGGREMMSGTREDDRRGRQVLVINLEYRYHLPFQILFDTYLLLRYDLGTISEVPEQIKLSSFRHGVGAEIAFDTPIGPGNLGAGKSFYFQERSPGSAVQHGPVLFYFTIGYQLYRP